MIYAFTWKNKATPLGTLYSQLVASAHRTSAKGYSFVVSMGQCLPPIASASPLPPSAITAPLAAWQSPTVTQISVRSPEAMAKRAEHRAKTGRKSLAPGNLAEQVTLYLGAWPTASARDGKGGYLGGRVRNGKISTDVLDVTTQLAAWTTASASDGRRGGTLTPNMTGSSLVQQARLTERLPGQTDLPSPIRLLTNGQVLIGYSAKMDGSGQLHPAHSRWLMGYRTEWDACAVTAMQSCPE
jgi:hypothetical protein